MNPPRETRFALVLNGGVSLAVWMGGVTHELNRLRLASLSGTRPLNDAEAAVHDAWVEILDKTSRKAVVDTIAGTSAGGLNGTLLGAAIASGRDLPDLKATWSQLAALRPGRLLRRGGEPSSSMFDGDFFHRQITALLTEMPERNPVARPRDVTLLVTATALDPRPTPIRLEADGRAAVVDSRRVYRFERSTDDHGAVKDDFTESRNSIALASRASASFPVAFEPVWETNALREFREQGPGKSKSSWLIDGGVLDNAPFEPLMETLRARPVGAPFDRVVLYVTPSPGAPGAPDGLGSHPSASKVLGRVLSVARGPDQRLDFQELRQAFERMGFTRSAPHDAISRLMCSPEPFMDTSDALLAAEQWFDTYRSSRAEAVERWLMSLGGDVPLAVPVLTELHPDELRSVPAKLVYPDQHWGWGVATAERALRWWGRALVDYSARNPDATTGEAFARLETSQRLVARLGGRLETHMNADLGSTPSTRATRLNAFYTTRVDAEIRAAVDATAQAITALPMRDGMDAATFINFTLAVEVISAALAWGVHSDGDVPRFRYRQITPAAESIVDIGEVTNGRDWSSRKLYGQRWGHFGAFAGERGREADWLWGRLDGASALCDYLLESVEGGQGLRKRLADAILEAEGTTEDGLREAGARASSTRLMDLLLETERTDRRVAVDLLWRRAVDLIDQVGERDPKRLAPGQVLRVFGDPTWTKRDLPKRTSFKIRLYALAVRWYGAPVRWLARRQLAKSLDGPENSGVSPE